MKRLKSKKFHFIIIAIIALVISLSSIRIMGKVYTFAIGFRGGTYEKFMMSLLKVTEIPISFSYTRGSEEIIRKVKRKYAEFGISQMDVLLKAYKDDSVVAQNIKLLLPLYPEEIHVLAKKSIKSISDLKGKDVSIGEEKSGTAATATIILKKIGLFKKIDKIYHWDSETLIQKIKDGEADAVFIVAGAPVSLLSSIPEKISKNYHLVPFDNKTIRRLSSIKYHYKESTLKAGTYPWQKDDVKTIAVFSTMIVNKSVPIQGVLLVLRTIFNNKSRLIDEHPKWSALDKNAIRFYLKGRKKRFSSCSSNLSQEIGQMIFP